MRTRLLNTCAPYLRRALQHQTRMFEDRCHIIDDAWWYYYHHKNYDLWQERADQLLAAMRKRMAAQKKGDEATALQEQLTFVNDVWDDDLMLDWLE